MKNISDLKRINYTRKPFNFMKIKPMFRELTFDIEVYPDYFLIGFMDIETREVGFFEIRGETGLETFTDEQRKYLYEFLYMNKTIGFNTLKYDIPVLNLALIGGNLNQINQRSEDVINNFRIKDRLPQLNHIDIIEVCPLEASLKIYGGRIHSKRLQDLPFKPGWCLGSDDNKDAVRDYCINNDLVDNVELYKSLHEQISLRESMGEQYGVDLRSKSDAQVAEAVIVSEMTRRTGKKPKKLKLKSDYKARYKAPDYIRFNDPKLREMLQMVENTEFVLLSNGNLKDPWYNEKTEKGLEVRIGKGIYRMGVGGLHSSEKSTFHKANDEYTIFDRDVASYYPRIILNLGLYPHSMGKEFLTVYNEIVERRLQAKKNKDTVTADSLKITINGSFGKFGSMYSALYSPDLLVAVTVTGQLSLLLFIEMMEYFGFEVVSANTDGIVIKVKRSRKKEYLEVVKLWEATTGFETEETEYSAIYSRDVNNYLAIKTDGKTKGKGAFTIPSKINEKLQKNPEHVICTEAIINYLVKDIPVEKTIKECNDFTKFISLRTVKGGGYKDGYYLGKSVRWYYAKGSTGAIRYILSNNMVPKTEGAKPCMELPELFPKDINYQWYINECESILKELGCKQLTLFD